MTAIEAFQTTLKLLSASKSQGTYVWLTATMFSTTHSLYSFLCSLLLVLLDATAQRRGSRSTKAQPLSVSDRATVHLELADTHLLLGQDKEAALVMEGAVKEFTGTEEEMR